MLRFALIVLMGCSGDPTTGDASTPLVEPAPTAESSLTALGMSDTMAVEVRAGDALQRRSSTDPSLLNDIRKVLEESTLSKSDTPRCAETLWFRFVPPGGQGGPSGKFCEPGGPATIEPHGHGSVSLDAASSETLYQLLQPVTQSTKSAVVPYMVEQSPTLEFSIGFQADAAFPQGLRSVVLTTSMLREQEATWADGAAINAVHPLTEDQSQNLAVALVDAGFLERATHYHSPAVETPTTEPPPDSEELVPDFDPGKPYYSRLTVTGGDWHLMLYQAMERAPYERVASHVTRVAPAGAITDIETLLDQVLPHYDPSQDVSRLGTPPADGESDDSTQ